MGIRAAQRSPFSTRHEAWRQLWKCQDCAYVTDRVPDSAGNSRPSLLAMLYEETQTYPAPLGLALIIVWAGLVAFVLGIGSSRSVILMAVLLGFLVLAGMFSRLSTTVGSEQIIVAFRAGWPRRVIPLETVVTATVVRNRWWYGWGLRKVPGGWLYNVWGLDAVAVERRAGSAFRIGTQDPAGLEAAIRLALSQQSS